MRIEVPCQWRLGGRSEGDFVPPPEQRAEDGAGSGLNRSLLRFLEGPARLRDGAGSVSSPLHGGRRVKCADRGNMSKTAVPLAAVF